MPSESLLAAGFEGQGSATAKHLAVRKAGSHAVVCLTLAAAALAGCGSSTSSSGLTHAELIARANAICKQANDRIVAVKKLPALGSGPPYAPLLRLLRDELPIFSAEIGALQRLKPSHGDEEAFGTFLRAANSELATAVSLRDASAAKDASRFRNTSLELVALSTKSAQAATGVGLVECAKQPEPKG